MTSYRLSPEAERDLDSIKRYLVQKGGTTLARHVIMDIRSALRFLANTPGAGHSRKDLTDQPVRFWAVYSYMIAYDPVSRPLGIARILHGAQDLEALLAKRPPHAGAE